MKITRSFLKLLSVLSVILLWTPYIAMVVTSIIDSIQAQRIIIHYFLPAELFYMIAIGLFGLNIIALNLFYRIKEVAITTIVTLVLMLNIVIVPQVVNIANMNLSPSDLAFIGIFVVLVLYIAFTLFAGIISIYMAKHLWYVKKQKLNGLK